jgi:hypothetical protein
MSSTTLRQLESLLDKLTLSEQAVLIEQLARRIKLAAVPARPQPQDLYGAWKRKLAEDVDLDAALREIRQAWQTEWDENGEFAE